MATGRTIFRRRPARRVRIAWRTWMPWYEPGRLIGEAQDMSERAEGVLLPAGGLVVVTAALVLALPALALVWPVIGAGALLALLLAAPGDADTDADAVAGQGLLGGPVALVTEVVEERREGTGYGNNDERKGAVELPPLRGEPQRHGGVRGQNGRTGPAGMGAGLGIGPVSARYVLDGVWGDKPHPVCLEETDLAEDLGADSTGGWADV